MRNQITETSLIKNWFSVHCCDFSQDDFSCWRHLTLALAVTPTTGESPFPQPSNRFTVLTNMSNISNIWNRYLRYLQQADSADRYLTPSQSRAYHSKPWVTQITQHNKLVTHWLPAHPKHPKSSECTLVPNWGLALRCRTTLGWRLLFLCCTARTLFTLRPVQVSASGQFTIRIPLSIQQPPPPNTDFCGKFIVHVIISTAKRCL